MLHSSVVTKNEYEAKHESGNTSKLTSVWENKVNQMDGGDLPKTFCKDPRELKNPQPASSLSSSVIEASDEADAGPAQSPVVSRKKSVVEIKSTFEKTATTAEDAEREVKRLSGTDKLSDEKRRNSSLGGNSYTEKTQLDKVQRESIQGKVNTLEELMKNMSATLQDLRSELQM